MTAGDAGEDAALTVLPLAGQVAVFLGCTNESQTWDAIECARGGATLIFVPVPSRFTVGHGETREVGDS